MAGKMLDLKAVADMIGVSYATVRRYRSQDPTFPDPDIVLGQTPGWLPDTITAWQDARPGKGVGGGRPRHDGAPNAYFTSKARDVFARAEGDPDQADRLAVWAQDAKQQGDMRRGVIVAEDGELIAGTRMYTGAGGGGPIVWYVDAEDAHRYGLTATEVGLATSALHRILGRRVIHVAAREICTGPGRKG